MTREDLKDKIYSILWDKFTPNRRGKWEIDNAVDEIAELFPLPPAEGAEQRIRVRDILQDFYRRGEYELEQAEEDIMRLFQPQPTAEGTDKFRSVLNEIQSLIETMDGATDCQLKVIWNHLSDAITASENPQPTAEGAEEIFRECFAEEAVKRGDVPLSDEKWNDLVKESGGFMFRAMKRFATLHAQRLADKMVSEKLREELIGFMKYCSATNIATMGQYAIDGYLKSRGK